MTPIAKNAKCHPHKLANINPAGTPATVATEKDVITMPVARPRRANGITSPMMVCDMVLSTPPKKPAAMRAAMSQKKEGATPQAIVVSANRV